MQVTLRCVVAILLIVLRQGDAGTNVVWGRITDQHGNPLPGVEVQALSRGSQRNIRANTDSSGEYALTSMSFGPAIITATLRGFRPSSRELSVHAGRNLWDTGLEVGLLSTPAASHITGVVTDSNSKPLSNATVTLWSIYQPSVVDQVRTDKAGRFEIQTTQIGQCALSATLPSHEAGIEATQLGTGNVGRLTVNFHLK